MASPHSTTWSSWGPQITKTTSTRRCAGPLPPVAGIAALGASSAYVANIDKATYNTGKTRVQSEFKADKAACGSMAGNAKDVCVKEAKAAETRGLAEAKLGKQVGEARKDAAQDIRDADYKVAIEKCDAMAGDSKASCVASAKTKFGKS
jgi:hypothetical protein